MEPSEKQGETEELAGEDARETLQRLQQVRLEDTVDAAAETVVEGMQSDDPEARSKAEEMLDRQNFVYNIYKSAVELGAKKNPEFDHSEEELMNISVLGGQLLEKHGTGDLLKYGLEIQFGAYLAATWFHKLRDRQERIEREQQRQEETTDGEERDRPDSPTGSSGRVGQSVPESPLR